MNDTDYNGILNNAITKLRAARARKNELELEIGKLRQFIFATVNMLSDEGRDVFLTKFQEIYLDEERGAVGLKEAITRVLQAEPKKWLTAANVRDRMLESGFDFTNYKTNPLASVSTTLTRMKPEEVEGASIEGVAAFRWKVKPMRGRRNAFATSGLYGGATSLNPGAITFWGQQIKAITTKKNE